MIKKLPLIKDSVKILQTYREIIAIIKEDKYVIKYKKKIRKKLKIVFYLRTKYKVNKAQISYLSAINPKLPIFSSIPGGRLTISILGKG